MIPLLISLFVLAGVGGTVIVSDGATPGSPLFPVDQTVEKVRLILADEDKDVELKAKFAKERLDEVDELLLEDLDDDGEDNDESNKENVEEGLSFAIDLISQIDEDGQFVDLTDQLNAILSGFPEGTDLNIKVTDSGSSFLKVWSESEDGEDKIKLEIKETGGGKVLIKTKSEDGKQEVEIENPDGSKFKMKTEDDGRLEIEVEDSDEDSEDGDDIEDDSDDTEDSSDDDGDDSEDKDDIEDDDSDEEDEDDGSEDVDDDEDKDDADDDDDSEDGDSN